MKFRWPWVSVRRLDASQQNFISAMSCLSSVQSDVHYERRRAEVYRRAFENMDAMSAEGRQPLLLNLTVAAVSDVLFKALEQLELTEERTAEGVKMVAAGRLYSGDALKLPSDGLRALIVENLSARLAWALLSKTCEVQEGTKK